MAPTPHRSERPGKAGTLLDILTGSDPSPMSGTRKHRLLFDENRAGDA